MPFIISRMKGSPLGAMKALARNRLVRKLLPSECQSFAGSDTAVACLNYEVHLTHVLWQGETERTR